MAFRRRMIYLLTFLVNTTVWRVGGTAVTFFFFRGGPAKFCKSLKAPVSFLNEHGRRQWLDCSWFKNWEFEDSLRVDGWVGLSETYIYFIYIFKKCIYAYCFRLYFRSGKTYHEGILFSYLNQCRVSMGFLIPTCGGHVMYHGISTPGAVKEVVKEPKPNWHPWCGGSLCFHKWNMSPRKAMSVKTWWQVKSNLEEFCGIWFPKITVL